MLSRFLLWWETRKGMWSERQEEMPLESGMEEEEEGKRERKRLFPLLAISNQRIQKDFHYSGLLMRVVVVKVMMMMMMMMMIVVVVVVVVVVVMMMMMMRHQTNLECQIVLERQKEFAVRRTRREDEEGEMWRE
jgi:hypothetical protein